MMVGLWCHKISLRYDFMQASITAFYYKLNLTSSHLRVKITLEQETTSQQYQYPIFSV